MRLNSVFEITSSSPREKQTDQFEFRNLNFVAMCGFSFSLTSSRFFQSTYRRKWILQISALAFKFRTILWSLWSASNLIVSIGATAENGPCAVQRYFQEESTLSLPFGPCSRQIIHRAGPHVFSLDVEICVLLRCWRIRIRRPKWRIDEWIHEILTNCLRNFR